MATLIAFLKMFPVETAYCVLAYFIGAIPFGVIVSKIVVGKDVRQQGSGNIGATNVARLMGKKWGILVLVLDALKGFAVVFASGWVGIGNIEFANCVAVAAILGHCYPVYLKFRGGKGVATALGVITALSPLLLGTSFLIFAAVIVISRRVSAASLISSAALPLTAFFFQTSIYPATAGFIAILIWWKHRENIVRLLSGKEPRFF